MIFASNPINWWTSHLGCNFSCGSSHVKSAEIMVGQWGILRRDRFYLYIPYFRGAGLINNPLHQSNSIKEPDVIFFFAAGFYWSLVKGECWLLSSLRPYFFVFMLRPNKGLVFIPLFGRFSACFFFNGMVWNMLKLPPTLWLEDFLLKFVIVVLASRVQVTPMVFADVSIPMMSSCLSINMLGIYTEVSQT